MDMSEVLSRLGSEEFKKRLSALSSSLSSEQRAELEKAVRALSSGGQVQGLKNLKLENLTAELSKNAELKKMLSENPALVNMLKGFMR